MFSLDDIWVCKDCECETEYRFFHQYYDEYDYDIACPECDSLNVDNKEYTLKTLLKRITKENKHGEISTGNAVGKEIIE